MDGEICPIYMGWHWGRFLAEEQGSLLSCGFKQSPSHHTHSSPAYAAGLGASPFSPAFAPVSFFHVSFQPDEFPDTSQYAIACVQSVQDSCKIN